MPCWSGRAPRPSARHDLHPCRGAHLRRVRRPRLARRPLIPTHHNRKEIDTTRLASGLPKGDGNGLDSLARQLIDEPTSVHVIVALVDCKKITTDTDTGDVEPTARVRRIEVISDEDKDLAAKMLRSSLEKRTGKTVLPFDLEEDIRAAFGNFDPKTGEVLD